MPKTSSKSSGKFDIIDELVTANRILAHEGIVDSFGHISVRHPTKKDRYLLSRARAPERIEPDDILEFTLEGDPIDAKKAKTTHAPYTERFIHGAIYEMRPEINSVVHNHSPSTIPFGITNKMLKPLLHMCASIGHEVPLWDSHDKFGDTALLVNTMAMGRDLAKRLGKGRTALMRGHGAVVAGTSIRHSVFISNYLELNAKLQMQSMAMGKIKYLTKGEVDAVIARTGPYTLNRAWENWCMRAGRKMQKLD
jgi:ribulose-5-phosphate 4-epimerase/fuculose-1-phosphate aldolase